MINGVLFTANNTCHQCTPTNHSHARVIWNSSMLQHSNNCHGQVQNTNDYGLGSQVVHTYTAKAKGTPNCGQILTQGDWTVIFGRRHSIKGSIHRI